jgi:hypothetical protein
MRNRRRRVCALLALAASLGATVYLGGHPHLPPCADEEAHNCVWDASEQGNGRGTDFVDIGGVVYQRVP